MTGMVFLLDRHGVCVGMDTLAVYADVKSPCKYCSKIFPLPHVLAAMCATGSHRIPVDWYVEIQTVQIARDIDYLNSIAPGRLRSIAARLGETASSTVYHFGFSPQAGAFTGTAFRSSRNFEPDQLQYGIGIKPGFGELLNVADDDIKSRGVTDGMIRVLERLREADDALPTSERVGIGGEIHILEMNAKRQGIHVVYKWPDFDDQFAQMLSHLASESS